MSKDFRKATDDLFSGISHQELATVLGCSVASIRQARLDEGASAYRKPPEGWEKAVLKLSEKQETHFAKLVRKLRPSE